MAKARRWSWRQASFESRSPSMLMDGIDLRGARMRPWTRVKEKLELFLLILRHASCLL